MDTFALIKEKNKTRLITDRDISDKFTLALLLCKEDFIDEIIKQDTNGFIQKIIIDRFEKSEIPLSKILVQAIRNKIIEDQELIKDKTKLKMSCIYAGETDYIIKLCDNIEQEIKISSANFDYVLKELGEIQANSDLDDYKIHACAKCDILSPLKCEKAEYIKKPISEYPFITEGYQIFIIDENEEIHMEKFIVRKCRNCLINFSGEYASSILENEKRIKKRRKINRLKNC